MKMKRRRRTQILIQGDPSLAEKFASEITANYHYQEVMAPRYGLTMVKMRETAKHSLFYMGEVLITEAKIEVEDAIGIGIVTGMEEALAYHLALIDAAYKANLPEITAWNEELQKAEKEITAMRAKKQAKLFETKVDFQTMDTDSI